MTWGAIGGAAVGVVGNAMMSDSGGGGGQTSSQSRQPWLPATPWLMDNLAQGQRLQGQYQAQPFNAQQQQAYQNQANQSAYMRAAVPSLLRQMQGEQVGFDRSNPNYRPAAFNWDGLLSAAKDGSRGLLDMLNSNAAINSSLDRPQQPKEEEKKFTQQDLGYTPQQQALIDSGRSPWLMGETQYLVDPSSASNGGYGEYRYGQTPQPGTQAYRDMMEFFLRGGNDPGNLAPGGLGVKRFASLPGLFGGPGVSVGDGIGVAGSAASVGSSANF